MSQLTFDPLSNAKDSLRHAVDVLAWPDSTRSNKYKQAILSVVHCAELLLKERIRRVNEAFVWENVDKYPSATANTVNVRTALSRLQKICKVRIGKDDKEKLSECLKLRNAIQHYKFQIPETVARAMLGKVLSFAFNFAESELNEDLRAEFTDDDTWQMLITEFEEFAEAHGTRIADRNLESVDGYGDCPICGQATVNLSSEYCELCDITFGSGEVQ